MHRGVVVLAAAGAVAATVLYQPHAAVRWLARRAPEVLFFVETDEPLVALTIDDGPHPSVTPEILDVLDEHEARATFFLIGERVPGNEPVVRRLVAAGHELGNHMMFDAPSIRMSPAAFDAELLEAHAILSAFGPVRWFRPGHGWFTRRMLRQVRACGYRCALGSVHPYDPTIPFERYLSRHILRAVRPGSVIVLHDGTEGRRRTVRVLRRVLPELRRRGYGVVTLSALADAGAGAK
jgi:peptidoglycan/xylan/chitin deacetylase (PgdA/CDA1 family)